MRLISTSILLCSASLIVACKGSPAELPDLVEAIPGSVSYVGVITARSTPSLDPQSMTHRRLSVKGSFKHFVLSTRQSEFGPFDTTCRIESNPATLLNEITDAATEYVSAGDVITVRGPLGSFPDLIEQPIGSTDQYLMEELELTQDSTPVVLHFGVPGAEFPSVPNLVMPLAQEVVDADISFNGSPVFEDSNKPDAFFKGSEFTWRAGDQPGTLIKIRFHSTEGAAICFAPEADGRWVFPEAVQSLMQDSYTDLAISRLVVLPITQNDAQVVLVSEYDVTLY